MKLNDISITKKLIGAFVLVLAIFCVLLVYQQTNLVALEGLQHANAERGRDVVMIGDMDSRLEHLYTIVAEAIIHGEMAEVSGEFRAFRTKAEADMTALAGKMKTPDEVRRAELFSKAYAGYLDLVENELLPALESGGADQDAVHDIDERIDTYRNEAQQALAEIKSDLEDEMNGAGEQFERTIINMEESALIAGISGVAIGLALAVGISLLISRPLKRTAAYARAVSEGTIDQDLDIRQLDEVGQVAWAMRRVVESLRTVLDENTSVIREIRHGRLRKRGDRDRFKGAFADLMGASNTLADTLVSYLDNVPNPMMCIDRDFNILFMNKTGAGVGGAVPEKVEGTRCPDFFRTSDCGTENCACAKAMKIMGKASSATDAHPAGADLMISYSGMPILDEKGEVVGAFELVVDETEIRTSEKRMRKVAQDAAQISDRLASAAEEISAQVEQSSNGADVQRQRAMESATAMEEMNSTVLEVARNASNAAENAEETKTRARSGSDVVDEVIKAMAGVETSASGLKTSMAELGEQAEGIGAIMNVISDIADQTNLLALNAAIEAARAGDAGRGFAVVADEVRKLAEKTMTATSEVGQAIQAIQAGTRSSMDSTTEAVEAISHGTELADKSGQVLEEIVGFAEDTADQVRAIAASAEEQSAVAEQINRSTEEISRISTETADAMDQSSQAVRELAALAAELQGLIAELRQS